MNLFTAHSARPQGETFDQGPGEVLIHPLCGVLRAARGQQRRRIATQRAQQPVEVLSLGAQQLHVLPDQALAAYLAPVERQIAMQEQGDLFTQRIWGEDHASQPPLPHLVQTGRIAVKCCRFLLVLLAIERLSVGMRQAIHGLLGPFGQGLLQLAPVAAQARPAQQMARQTQIPGPRAIRDIRFPSPGRIKARLAADGLRCKHRLLRP